MKYIYILLILSIYSCKEKTKLTTYRFGGMIQGTSYNIQFIADKDTSFKFTEGIDTIFSRIDKIFSTYRDDSEISKVNSQKYTHNISEEFKKIFNISKEINKNTNGIFDPTVGIIVKDIGFSSQNNKKSTVDIDTNFYKYFVGLEKINIKNDTSIVKLYKNVFIDFNSIIKGYTVDCVAEYLENNNINNYLIEIGGEIRAKGYKVDNSNWIIGIDAPIEDLKERDINFIMKIRGKSIATSGNYRKFKIDSLGNKYVHTINPKTLSLSEGKILSASVLHNKCMYADAFATAIISCKDIEKAKLIIKKNNLDVYIIYIDKKNKQQIFTTDIFKKLDINYEPKVKI